MESFGGPDHYNLALYNLGIEYMSTAEKLEDKGKLEHAYKFYKESANKFMFLLKAEEAPHNKKEL